MEVAGAPAEGQLGGSAAAAAEWRGQEEREQEPAEAWTVPPGPSLMHSPQQAVVVGSQAVWLHCQVERGPVWAEPVAGAPALAPAALVGRQSAAAPLHSGTLAAAAVCTGLETLAAG